MALESRLAKVRARKSGKIGESMDDGAEGESIDENDIKNAEKIDSREEKETESGVSKSIDKKEQVYKRHLPEWARHNKGRYEYCVLLHK